jgi:hypothetical protein
MTGEKATEENQIMGGSERLEQSLWTKRWTEDDVAVEFSAVEIRRECGQEKLLDPNKEKGTINYRMWRFKIVRDKTELSERIPETNERCGTHATQRGRMEVKNEAFSESIVQSWHADSQREMFTGDSAVEITRLNWFS